MRQNLGSGANAAVRRAQRVDPALTPISPAIVQETIRHLDLEEAKRTVPRGFDIVREGRRCNSISLFIEGVAIHYRILRDGQRQIFNVLLPGDFAGAVTCRFETALYSIRSLTSVTLAPIPLPRLLALFDSHPTLAARLFWRISCESTVLCERLTAIGRLSARERVAHFLLELLVRLQVVGLAGERSYRLPLTREMIADMLGLSKSHMSRIFQELCSERLLSISDQMVHIDNIDELAALGHFEPGYLRPLAYSDLAAQSA